MSTKTRQLINFLKRLAILFAALALTAAPAWAQIAFTAPENVSNSSGKSFSQSIAVDASGNISVAWVENSSGASVVMFVRSSNGGESYSAPRDISNHSGTNADSPKVALDPSGNIYVVWSESSSTAQTAYFTRSIDGGTTFSAPQVISNSSANGSQVMLAVDAGGSLNLVWSDSSPGHDDVFYRRSTNAGASFTAPINLSNNPLGAGSPNVSVDSQGNIYVAWINNSSVNSGGTVYQTQDVFFSISTNEGSSFATPYNVTGDGPNVAISKTQVAANATDNLSITWEAEQGGSSTLFYRNSGDGGATFGKPESAATGEYPPDSSMVVDSGGGINIAWQSEAGQGSSSVMFARSTIGGGDFVVNTVANVMTDTPTPQLAMDAMGNMNIVFSAGTNAGIQFIRSTNTGATFSPPHNISADGGINPQMSLDAGGNIYVVWQAGCCHGAGRHLEVRGDENQNVFFSRNLALSALRLEPMSVPAGGSARGTVTMNGPAPRGGAVVALSSSDSSTASVPAYVTVRAGSTSATFRITTSATRSSPSVTITASFDGISDTAQLTIDALTLVRWR